VDLLAMIASTLCCVTPPITLGYAFTCAVWPFKPCRRCAGSGRIKALIGRSFRLCRRCDGTGRRIRYGRHLWNDIRRAHRDATH
jgi:DnaJ-class molecular chaperone